MMIEAANIDSIDSPLFRLLSASKAGTGRELTPKDVLADLLGEELPLDDPDKIAQMIIERLADAGFVIWPQELPKPPKA